MQSKLVFLLLLPLFLSLSEFSQSQSPSPRQPQPPSPPQFDHFILALQYEPFFPNLSRRRERFTIHGLWPSSSRGNLVVHCSTAYNDKEVKNMFIQLYTAWPDQESGDHYGFWKREWLKHGTCSGLNEHDYFSQALKLYKENDVFSNLRKAFIFPGQLYPAQQILQKYKTENKEYPRIVCSGATHDSIKEIHLNFTTTFDLQSILSSKQIKDCQGTIKLPKGSSTFISKGSTLT